MIVEHGVRLLDKRRPGWRTRINPDALYMGYPDACILGQLFGSYRDGLSVLGIEEHSEVYGAAWYGFDVSPAFGSYGYLTTAWKEVL